MKPRGRRRKEVTTPATEAGSDYHSSMTDNVQLPFPDAGKETGRQLFSIWTQGKIGV